MVAPSEQTGTKSGHKLKVIICKVPNQKARAASGYRPSSAMREVQKHKVGCKVPKHRLWSRRTDKNP